jgi:hypothetical protein
MSLLSLLSLNLYPDGFAISLLARRKKCENAYERCYNNGSFIKGNEQE